MVDTDDEGSDPPNVDKGVTPVLGWHRVCLNTIVRATKDLESARLRILPMGSRVNVVEVDGRRVRIDEPIGGWCSIESSNGDLILSPTNEERDDGAAGLAGGAADQGRVGALEKELQELKWLREEVAAKNMEEIHKNFEQSASGLEDLKAKHANLKQKLSSNASNQTLAELNRRIKQTQTMLSLKKAERSNIHDEIAQTAEHHVPSGKSSEFTMIQNGDVVLMKSGDMVIVRYVGKVHWGDDDREWIGCELSDYDPECHDGSVKGHAYFTCKPGFGKFILKTQMKKKIPAEALLQMLQVKVEELHLEQSGLGKE